MMILYEPRGAAREYAPLAANLYRGCTHGCRYCYAPSCLYTQRETFHAEATVRPRVLEQLRREAGRVGRPEDPILLCFTCDPYQPLEETEQVTRQAIEILGEAGRKIRVLTKRPTLALRDVYLFRKYDVELGVSAVWADDDLREQWEPGADSMRDRYRALVAIRHAGVRTWLSMEPVIDPAQALRVLDLTARWCTVIKVGKINHDKARSDAVDWRAFGEAFCGRMHYLASYGFGCAYYIKEDLWRACGPNPPFPRQWTPAESLAE